MMPTAVSIASRNAAVVERVQAEFKAPYLRLYGTDDVVGVEIGGALKNVIAIAVGIAMAMGLGDNTRATLITRGLAEIARLGSALGAQTQDVLYLVVRQGMNPVILGLIFGLAGTFAVGRLLAAQLYQISPYDPLLLGATAIVLAVAALLACWIPARRATLVDPIQALRSE